MAANVYNRIANCNSGVTPMLNHLTRFLQKKYLMSSLKEYWDLVKRREMLETQQCKTLLFKQFPHFLCFIHSTQQ